MKIALVEDNKEYATLLINDIMHRNEDVSIEYFVDGESFLQSSLSFDLVILDIELPGVDGIKVSKTLASDNTKIVFLTSTKDRVFEAFGENVVGYLLKEINSQEVINQLMNIINQVKKTDFIHLVTELGEADFDVKCIIKVTKENRKIYLTTDKKQLQIYRNTLTNIYENANGSLLYVNKSTLINIIHMKSFTDKKIVMDNGFEETISRDYLQRFKREYLARVAL